MKELNKQTVDAVKRMEEYNENPKKCLHCKKGILAKTHRKLSDVKRKKFCSRSCAAKYNNKKFPKRSVFLENGKFKLKSVCPECGGKKYYTAKTCHDCKKLRTREIRLNKTIKETVKKGNARVKYAHIRQIARDELENSSKEKKCVFCKTDEFKEVLETCHVKDIAEFDEQTLIREVNSIDNLEWMCPSHHTMFDKGLLSLKEKKDG